MEMMRRKSALSKTDESREPNEQVRLVASLAHTPHTASSSLEFIFFFFTSYIQLVWALFGWPLYISRGVFVLLDMTVHEMNELIDYHINADLTRL